MSKATVQVEADGNGRVVMKFPAEFPPSKRQDFFRQVVGREPEPNEMMDLPPEGES